MFKFVLCHIPPPDQSKSAQLYTKAFVSFGDYKRLMQEIQNIYNIEFFNNGPYILIENQVFEIEPNMNLYDGSIAINNYHRVRMNKSISDLLTINFIHFNGIYSPNV